VEVEIVSRFDDALELLEARPPDAVIVNLGPAELPWQELKRRCETHNPPIPVLFESCVHTSVDEAGIGDMAETSAFLAKPYHSAELEAQIKRLLETSAGGLASAAVAAETDPESPASSSS